MFVNRNAARHLRRERGFSMLETLVTLFIISIWLLGSAGVQTIAMKFTKTAQQRNVAVLLATDISERMELNKAGATTGLYVYDGSTRTLGLDCRANPCNPTQLASFDLYEWYTRSSTTLPGATFKIDPVGAVANPMKYTITITWLDRRTGQAYAGTLDTNGTKNEKFTYVANKSVYLSPT